MGMTIVAGTEKVRAARERDCAWLPEEWVITPEERRVEGEWGEAERRRRREWKAPRVLKAPARWRFSALRKRESLGCEGREGGESWGLVEGVEEEEGRGERGVEARVLRVELVRTGVRWM